MQLHIKRGTINRPQRLVIYAPEGLGKSTLASELPDPLFLDYEKGTHHLDVARIEPANLKETEEVLGTLAKDASGFQTLVVDTVDWLEELAIQDVCEKHKKDGLEDFGYGKGYVFLAERFNAILTQLNACAARMNVVLLAHSHVKKFELPDGAGAYDRYELKLSRQVGPLVREWCDALLFGNWKTKIRERDDGNKQTTYKGLGGKERILYCAHAAAWDAKNRHGLKDEEPWIADTVKRCLGSVAQTNHEPVKPSQPKPAGNAAPPATKTKDAAGPTNGAALTSDSDGIPGLEASNGGPQEHALTPIVGEHETAVNEYLVSRAVIQPGQTYRDVKPEYVAKVQKSPQGFMTQALKGKGVAA